MSESKLLKGRAPETREILGRIPGWALNWTSTLGALAFVGLLYAATWVTFPARQAAQAQVLSDGTLVATPGTLAPGAHADCSVDGQACTLRVTAREEWLYLDAPGTVLDLDPGPVRITFIKEVHLLGAVFKDIF